MKLKRWLILSHLAMILTPLVSGVLLYAIIDHYNENKEVMDYIMVMGKFGNYESVLENPELYKGKNLDEENFIFEEDEDAVVIELFNLYGQQIYSSKSSLVMGFAFSKENTYSDLYKIQSGAKSYTLKKPVFKDEELIGFYKISISRNDFIEGINHRTILIFSLFAAIVLSVFIMVIKLLDKKLNKPVRLLTEGMNDFAEGKESNVNYKANDEIGEIIFHFNSMKEDIEEKRKAIELERQSKDYMISSISHDLKTPLTAIRAYAETIIEEEEEHFESVKEKAKVILSKSDYIKTMIDDLMMYNLLSTGYEMNFVDLEGNEFFEMLFSGYEEQILKKKIILESNIRVSGKYRADVNQMTRVTDNLMANALRYTPSSGHIWMGAFSMDEKFPEWIGEDFEEKIRNWRKEGILIFIQNEGSGIEEGEKKKIFEPFYQIDGSRNKMKWNGVGLGLSIVRLIIEKHGGEMLVLSEENLTSFVCWIPN